LIIWCLYCHILAQNVGLAFATHVWRMFPDYKLRFTDMVSSFCTPNCSPFQHLAPMTQAENGAGKIGKKNSEHT
jgi:hypothetical protein